jgi:multisubunit Na+/H+ antiporter MnhE subunit
MTAATAERWSRDHWLALGGAIVAGVLVRLLLLPTDGLRGDLDQFVGWVHHIATDGLGTLYSGTDAGPVTFGPVMAYVWALLAAIQPAFATITDSSDPAIRALMKTPASLADFGLAGLAAWGLRGRPGWAVVAAAAVILHPAIFYVSAWWGQYESIFMLSGLGAVVAAINGRPGLAAALVAVSLMTKPQAIPFLVPFAAWFWAQGYAQGAVRGASLAVARAAAIGIGVIVVLWLPFLAAGGPAGYLANLGTYQNEIFNVLSLRAWNPWWLLQEAAAGGDFIRDDVAFAGPLTLRHLGYVVTAILTLVIGWVILRDARPRTFILGLVASVLVVFTFMTQMHERYAYAALILLVLLLPDVRMRWLWLLFGTVFTLNLLAAIPPTPDLAAALPVNGPLAVAGAVSMTLLTAMTLRTVVGAPAFDSATARSPRGR